MLREPAIMKTTIVTNLEPKIQTIGRFRWLSSYTLIAELHIDPL